MAVARGPPAVRPRSDDLHVPAWKWFDEVDAGGDVGFWAELYVVEADNYENFYRNVPPIGLGATCGLVPDDAERRPSNRSEDGVPPARDGDRSGSGPRAE